MKICIEEISFQKSQEFTYIWFQFSQQAFRSISFGATDSPTKKGFGHGGISKKKNLGHFSPSFLGQKYQFQIHIPLRKSEKKTK